MPALKDLIRDIPDFPKPGIIFKDIAPLLQNPEAFRQAVDELVEKHRDHQIDAVVCVEARGFLLGAAVAYKLGAAIVPVRKPGKLPYKTYQATYQLEYGTDTLEIHQDAIAEGDRILVVDDVLATGGTVKAVTELVKRMKGEIVGIVFLIELTFLNGREKLQDYPMSALITF